MVDGDRRRGVVALEDGREEGGELTGADAQLERGQDVLELLLEADRTGHADGAGGHRLGEEAAHGLVRLVLEEAGEEEVTGFEEFEVEFLLPSLMGRQARSLEVEEGGGDEEELGDLGEVGPPPPSFSDSASCTR